MAGLSWDSANIQAAIVGFFIENGYGSPTSVETGDTTELFEALIEGSVDVYLEAWSTTLPGYDDAVDKGLIFALGNSLEDSWQSAFVVPTYVIKGDSTRDIAAMAPDLKTPQDIRKYQDLFRTGTTRGKARLENCIEDSVCSKINAEKVSSYDLDDVIKLVDPGTYKNLFDSLEEAYLEGEPWLGYLWGPSQSAFDYELTRLEEDAYSDECWASHKKCAYQIAKIRKAVHPSLAQRAPEVLDFLRKWNLDAATQVELETMYTEFGENAEITAIKFLQNKESLWTAWVPEDVAERVKKALDGS